MLENLNSDLAPPGVETVEKESWQLDTYKAKETPEVVEPSKEIPKTEKKDPERNCYTPDLTERRPSTSHSENQEKRKEKSKREKNKEDDTKKEKKSSREKKKKKKEKEQEVKKVKKHKHKHDKEKEVVKEHNGSTPEVPVTTVVQEEAVKEEKTEPVIEPEPMPISSELTDEFDIERSDSIVDLYGNIELELKHELDFARSFESDSANILPLPEVSKWEKEDELEIEAPKDLLEKDEILIDETSTHSNVTSDVIKRAENAIYSKPSGKLLDDHKEDDRRSKRSHTSEETSNKTQEKRGLESKIITIRDGDGRKESKASSSHRLQSRASPVRLSIKDRLGEKVKDEKVKSHASSSHSRDPKRQTELKVKERLDGNLTDRRRSRTRSGDRRRNRLDTHRSNDDKKGDTKHRRDRSSDRSRRDKHTDTRRDGKSVVHKERRHHRGSETESSSVSSDSSASTKRKKEKKKKRSRSIDSANGSDDKKKKSKKRSKSSKRKKKKH